MFAKPLAKATLPQSPAPRNQRRLAPQQCRSRDPHKRHFLLKWLIPLANSLVQEHPSSMLVFPLIGLVDFLVGVSLRGSCAEWKLFQPLQKDLGPAPKTLWLLGYDSFANPRLQKTMAFVMEKPCLFLWFVCLLALQTITHIPNAGYVPACKT